MNFSSKLNANAASVNFEMSKISTCLKEFFKVLFISWKTNNVDAIISSVSLDTIEETDLFFRELFINIYNLSLKSETNLNCDNVICALNTLDTTLPEVLIFKSDVPDFILADYENVKEKAFQQCFKRVRILFNLLLEIKKDIKSSVENNEKFVVFNKIVEEISNVLLVLSRLSRIKYSQTYLLKFSFFLWELFNTFNDLSEIRHVLLFALSNISDQLVTFLLWKFDSINDDSGLQLALEIFDRLKSDLINRKFFVNETAYVLNILEQRGRFLGQFLDAVPENNYYNGFIIGHSAAKSLETDEVYEDYEKFLLNESD